MYLGAIHIYIWRPQNCWMFRPSLSKIYLLKILKIGWFTSPLLSVWTSYVCVPPFTIYIPFCCRFGEPLVHIVSEPVRTFYVAFGMQKDSPFTAKFSATFARLIEGGFLLLVFESYFISLFQIFREGSSSSGPRTRWTTWPRSQRTRPSRRSRSRSSLTRSRKLLRTSDSVTLVGISKSVTLADCHRIWWFSVWECPFWD